MSDKIRLLSTGNDAHVFRGQTVRVLVTNAKALQGRRDAIDRYMAAYRDTIAWLYSDPAALKIYAEFASVTEARAKQIRDDVLQDRGAQSRQVVGLDIIMPDAVALKYTAAPLTKEQLAELIQIPPRK